MTRRNSLRWWWLLAVSLLTAATVAGVAVFTIRYVSRPDPVEIVVASPEVGSPFEVYLSGTGIREGIYTVDRDATLDDILQRAGVISSDGESLRIKISVIGPEDDPFSEEQSGQTGKININTASLAELVTLPGIGPVKAQAIIDYRNQNGPFRAVDDLLKVSGIGPKTLETIRDKITVFG